MKISYSSIVSAVTSFISKKTGIHKSMVMAKNNLQALGLDQLDLVNLILELEQKYQITIPDEVPLESISDLIHYVYQQKAA